MLLEFWFFILLFGVLTIRPFSSSSRESFVSNGSLKDRLVELGVIFFTHEGSVRILELFDGLLELGNSVVFGLEPFFRRIKCLMRIWVVNLPQRGVLFECSVKNSCLLTCVLYLFGFIECILHFLESFLPASRFVYHGNSHSSFLGFPFSIVRFCVPSNLQLRVFLL